MSTVFDRLGRLQSVVQGGNSWAYAYDPTHLFLDTETIRYDTSGDGVWTNGTVDFERVLDRSRDAQLRNNGWQLKAGATVEHACTFGYDAVAGRTSTVTRGGGGVFTYAYHPAGPHLVTGINGPNGITISIGWELNRDVLNFRKNNRQSTTISMYDYTTNSMSRRNRVDRSGTAFGGTYKTEWEYNARGEATKEDDFGPGGHDSAYEFDDNGNRLRVNTAGLTLPAYGSYSVNALDQYTAAAGTYVPLHDLSGNLVHDDGWNGDGVPRTLTWDGEHQLTKVVNYGGGALVGEYRYDPFGRRISRKVGAGSTTWYIYDGWNMIAEYNASGGLPVRTHTWGLDFSGSLQGAGGVGGLLVSKISGVDYYPLYDGNVVQYISSSGTVAASYEYNLFGRQVAQSGSWSTFNYRYSTKFTDDETDLVYYGYRYYSPFQGRWLNRDPIGEQGGLNLYGMVGNDAVNAVDVLGLVKFEDHHWFPEIRQKRGAPRGQPAVDNMCGNGFLNVNDYTTTMEGPSTTKGTAHFQITHDLQWTKAWKSL